MSDRADTAMRLAATRPPSPPASERGLHRSPLLRRVFAVNAAVLSVAAVANVLVLSPGVVSEPVAIRELFILLGSLVVMLVVNFLLLRRTLEPLRTVADTVDRVDPRRPGQRVAFTGDGSEPSRLAAAFNDMLDRLETERRESARRALAAQEGERLRVAQELHDEIGQSLTAVLLQLERTARHVDDEVREELAEARETARASLDELRRIAQRLRPEALDELGLTSALAGFAERVAEQAGIRVERRLQRQLPPLDYEEELVLYRVAQEALTNVVRHSGSPEAELTLEAGDDEVLLRIGDRGRGLGSGEEGGGIRGMYERALLIGAELSIRERNGGGLEVLLRLPIEGRP
jgi:two-component system, NarL family, sensor histidine kinase UhpB